MRRRVRQVEIDGIVGKNNARPRRMVDTQSDMSDSVSGKRTDVGVVGL